MQSSSNYKSTFLFWTWNTLQTSVNCPVCIWKYWNFWSTATSINVHNWLYYCTYFCMFFVVHSTSYWFVLCNVYTYNTYIPVLVYIYIGNGIHILYVHMKKLSNKYVYACSTLYVIGVCSPTYLHIRTYWHVNERGPATFIYWHSDT